MRIMRSKEWLGTVDEFIEHHQKMLSEAYFQSLLVDDHGNESQFPYETVVEIEAGQFDWSDPMSVVKIQSGYTFLVIVFESWQEMAEYKFREAHLYDENVNKNGDNENPFNVFAK